MMTSRPLNNRVGHRVPRHVAFFLPTLEGGGAERVMLNLSQGLRDRNTRVDFVLAQVEGELVNQVPQGVRLIGLNPLRLPWGRTFAALPLLVRYLRRAKPEVLLTASDRANLVGIVACKLALTETKAVVTIHRLFSRQTRGLNWLYVHCIEFLARRLYRSAERIVAVSRGAAAELATLLGIPESRISVVYNPVLTADLAARARQPFNHPWFSPDSPPVVLSVGRLEDPKDFTTLIRAFAVLRENHEARLLILGEGPQRAGLTDLVRQLGLEREVAMAGFAQNPYPYMSRAAALVLSSRSEALPTVLIEALFLGTPVVSTDCPSGPGEILRGGRYGRLVQVGDKNGMVLALQEVLTTPRVASSKESWQAYTVPFAARKYIEVIAGDADNNNSSFTSKDTTAEPSVFHLTEI